MFSKRTMYGNERTTWILLVELQTSVKGIGSVHKVMADSFFSH